MPERTEIRPNGHPWFLELSQALGVQFEQPVDEQGRPIIQILNPENQ